MAESSSQLEPLSYRDKVIAVEDILRPLPGTVGPEAFPLKHSFAEGLYGREIFVPKGYLIVTKIHRFSHITVILKGKCSVLQEDGIKIVSAPQYFITPAGTKRMVYVHEDTEWLTVHATRETDLDRIEDELIAKSFDDLDNAIEIESFVKEAQALEGAE